MKKKYILSAALFFMGMCSHAQNLVPNPGFDAVSVCPVSLSQIFFCQPWSWPSSHTGTSDYFSSCYSGSQFNVGTPHNFYGYQQPLSGGGYAGIVPLSGQGYREYVSVALTVPLVAGQNYYVGFYVNQANNSSNSVDALGAHISTGFLLGVGDDQYLPVVPQIENPAGNLITDTVNWTLISGVYTASGGEDHITIGNFKADANTQYIGTGVGNEGYYYVDDVYVIPTSLYITGNEICQGGSVTLHAYGDSTFAWVDSQAPSTILSTNSTFTVSPSDTTTYFVYSPGDTASFTVNVKSLPQFNLGNDTTLCEGETVMLDPAIQNVAYSWQDGSTDSSFHVTQAGFYILKTTMNGCSFIDTVQVDIVSPPLVNLGSDTILCLGTTLTLDATLTDVTCAWQDNSTDSIFQVSQFGTYWLKVTNAFGCANADTILIDYRPALFIDIGPDLLLCPGDSATLNTISSQLNVSYLWNDGATSSQMLVNQTGQYFVAVTNECETLSDTVNVNFETHPVDYLGNDTIVCAGESIVLQVDIPGSQTTWQNQSQSNSIVVNSSGTYTASTITQNACLISDEVIVDFIEAPEFDLGPDKRVCDIHQYELFNLEWGYEGTYLWNTGSTEDEIYINAVGLYFVEMTNQCGYASDTIIIDDEGCNCYVYLPNSFSPNADEYNATFGAKYDCTFSEFYLQIYNRWGEMIWQSNDPEIHWDGTYQNRKVKEGVYSYKLIYSSEFVTNKLVTGHVSVLR